MRSAWRTTGVTENYQSSGDLLCVQNLYTLVAVSPLMNELLDVTDRRCGPFIGRVWVYSDADLLKPGIALTICLWAVKSGAYAWNPACFHVFATV